MRLLDVVKNDMVSSSLKDVQNILKHRGFKNLNKVS